MPSIRPVWLPCVLLLAGCGGGGDSGGTNPVPAASSSVSAAASSSSSSSASAGTSLTAAQVEASQGSTLQRPVSQCGTGVDTVTGDTSSGSVTVFESDPVRPIVLSADGQRLYVANAPANCLEIYAVQGDTLQLRASVAVGLEPVAIAERNADEVWVVNHLSDSVSIVRLDGTPRVLRTLLVGDEPRDIVFAGTDRQRAFISAANRGQNRPGFTSASLTTAGTGRADVWVFDGASVADSLNGGPLAIITLFADKPRALAVSADGRTVYAAPFMSGNRTTVIHRDALGGAAKPGPNTSADGVAAPATGLVVKFDGSAWRDETGTDWSSRVRFTLPDYDFFAIDAAAATPAVRTQFSGVGTTLFNMAVSPVDGRVFISNTEAVNQVRFEGPGTRGTTVRGRIAESRVTVLNPATGALDPVRLNSHLTFNVTQGQAIAPSDKARSLAQPMAMLFSPSGDTLYVAAFGSAKVAVLPTASVASTAFVPDASRHITVPAGPAGLALNASGSRLYVYSRLVHSVSVIDTATRAIVGSVTLFAPEAAAVRTGRMFLYDAVATSANGSSSCGSCHIFGDMDQLAWDLGNPDDVMKNNPNAYVALSPKTTTQFHPLKGPMTTQTLRGMSRNGPLHWRGDRTGANRVVVRGTLEPLEEASFKEFNPAFVGLVGRETELTASQMQAFTDFAMTLTMPPNPVRALDNSLTAEQQAGSDLYNGTPTTLLGNCNACHTLQPANGRFGTRGLMSFEGGRVTENFKVPQLRNIYQKAGMFGFSAGSGATTGPQIRGFGFVNDGSIDTLDNFFSDPVFFFPAPVERSRAQVIDFVLAMDSDLLPVVGQQVSWRTGSSAAIEARLGLLKAQALVTTPRPACDLAVRANIGGATLNGLLQADGSWLMRDGSRLGDAQLRALARAAEPLTFTCLPPGTGRRVALNLN